MTTLSCDRRGAHHGKAATLLQGDGRTLALGVLSTSATSATTAVASIGRTGSSQASSRTESTEWMAII